MRRYESIQGYVITEFTTCIGKVMVGWYVPHRRSIQHLLKKINADDVLIPIWSGWHFVRRDCNYKSVVFALFIC